MVKSIDTTSEKPTDRVLKKPVPPKPQEREFPKLTLNGITYYVGDCVRIREWEDESSFARIIKIFTRDKEALLLIRWFYKPSDIWPSVPEYLGQGELFDSDVENEVWAVSVYDKIKLISLEQYEELDEVGDETYFCRAKFFSSSGEVVPPVESWPKVCVCNKPFNPEITHFSCDKCSKIFHPACIGAQIADVCPACREGDSEWLI